MICRGSGFSGGTGGNLLEAEDGAFRMEMDALAASAVVNRGGI
jgi:hypothetical protein